MTPGFTAKQVTALAGVPYQTIHLWAKTGFIVPSVSQASGRGTERVYSFLDIVALRIAGELRRAGIPTRALKNVVRFLRERELLEDPDTKLAVVGRDVFIAKANDPISVLKKPGQGYLAFVLDIGVVISELRTAPESAKLRPRKGPGKSHEMPDTSARSA